MSSKVYVKKALPYDINPITGEPHSMLRIQDYGIESNQGIPASEIAVPPRSIDFENTVANPAYRFPVGQVITDERLMPSNAKEMSPDKYQEKLSQGYNKPGYMNSNYNSKGYVKPNRGLFYTPANLQDLSEAEVTGTDQGGPARLLGSSQDPLLQDGLKIRPGNASPEDLNEIFSSTNIAPKDVTDLTPLMTTERGYNPLWFNSKDPESAMEEERKFLERGTAATTEQIQNVARMLRRNPQLFARNANKPTVIANEKQYNDLDMDPDLFETYQTDDGEWGVGNAGHIADFLREKINLKPMDRGWKQVLGNRGLPDKRINQMISRNLPPLNNLSEDKLNSGLRTLADKKAYRDFFNSIENTNYRHSDEVPPEFIDKNPERGFARQGIDIDAIMDKIKGLELKSDTSISKTDFGLNMGYEPCDCCTPMQQASIALLGDYFEKASKKPFHGYNPKRHHMKGGLNQAGRDKFKRETGANLKPPVTTKPSKLKPGSKKAKRRKSFCARMGGSKGATSKEGKLTPKGAALKRWNC